MRRVVAPCYPRKPPHVSIPIPSEKGMRLEEHRLLVEVDPVSIPIPSEKGMRRGGPLSLAAVVSSFNPHPLREGDAPASRSSTPMPSQKCFNPHPLREGDAPGSRA